MIFFFYRKKDISSFLSYPMKGRVDIFLIFPSRTSFDGGGLITPTPILVPSPQQEFFITEQEMGQGLARVNISLIPGARMQK